MAPEILNGKQYAYKVDMWSIGVSMFEALIGQTPFFGTDRDDLTRNVNAGLIRLSQNLNLSNSCLDFLSKCLRYDPGDRISIDHAMNHPFINPDSPQYMDRISLKPLMQASKSITNVLTSNTLFGHSQSCNFNGVAQIGNLRFGSAAHHVETRNAF